MAAIALVAGYLTIPIDRMNRATLDLDMDWAGSLTITSGLILVVYALSASASGGNSNVWTTPSVLAPFVVGLVCLALAVYIEGWVARSPLMPFTFFQPKGVKPFMIGSLFLYGCFGVWLFTVTTYLEVQYGVKGFKTVLWFLPLAAGGIFFAITGSALLHVVPIFILLCVSALAFVAAPLLMALAHIDAGYWPFVFPAMVCGTLGIDITYTISCVFLTSAQPVRFQGLAGAICSLLVNLAIAFSLSFAEIVESKAFQPGHGLSAHDVQARMKRSSQAAFWFATASAAVGVIVVVLFVRVSRKTVNSATEERSQGSDQQMSAEDARRADEGHEIV